MPNKFHHECPLSFDEALARFLELSELYGHLDPVTLHFYKGGFDLTYTTYEKTDRAGRE